MKKVELDSCCGGFAGRSKHHLYLDAPAPLGPIPSTHCDGDLLGAELCAPQNSDGESTPSYLVMVTVVEIRPVGRGQR